MKRILLCLAPLLTIRLLGASGEESPANAALRLETFRVAEASRLSPPNLEAWTNQAAELRRELLQMHGLWPLPERTDLKPIITGVLEEKDFIVEKLHFQALPRVYVTANLYRPKSVPRPAPAVLYVCGHARVFTNGVSYGNKTAYQHHGIWFARNGYVCLTIDTLQLGEIEGVHHGTYREGRWWWNSRGFTPAGVEAWFGIRALDYLCTRPEVDPQRLGMTGRSGGGSYTWTVAALDERVKVAVPVAGITDLENQVADSVVNGHCDCMFFLNQARWDFPKVAALIAPRPLLFANSDNDSIFPLDGVYRVHEQVKRIYQLYGKQDNLGFLITPGPHSDTQELQLPAFRWFNHFLKQEPSLVSMAAVPLFTPEQLRVFSEIPADQLNTSIDQFFVPQRKLRTSTETLAPDSARALLLQHVFAAWPDNPAQAPRPLATHRTAGCVVKAFELETAPGVRLPLWVVFPSDRRNRDVILHVLDEERWTNSPFASPETLATGNGLVSLPNSGSVAVYFPPRLVADVDYANKPQYRTSMRRKHMLLGQTVDSMRVFDIRSAIQALPVVSPRSRGQVIVSAEGTMAVNAAYAALFERNVDRVVLTRPSPSHQSGPDYLNILQVLDVPELFQLLDGRVELQGAHSAGTP